MTPHPDSTRPPDNSRFHLPDGSRSAQSPWVWRGFLFMSLIALGLSITFAAGAQPFYTVSWAVIATGWFTTAMWLWRKHLRWEDTQQKPVPARQKPDPVRQPRR